MIFKKIKNNSGYTIIETMISISIFLVVIMVGMNTLLNANMLHRKSQDMRAIIDNLSFIMEEMSRNIRTGYNYHCDREYQVNPEIPLSCADGDVAIAFESSTGSIENNTDQWVYFIDASGNIFKSIDSGNSAIQLNNRDGQDGVIINRSESGFWVTGAEPPSDPNLAVGDLDQPFVKIKLVGSITYKGKATPFTLETGVSQRLVDNVIQ